MQKLTTVQAREVKGGWAVVLVPIAFGAGYAFGSMLRRLF